MTRLEMIVYKVMLIMELGGEIGKRKRGHDSMSDDYLLMLRIELDTIKERLQEA
jgi:hypothetical protein